MSFLYSLSFSLELLFQFSAVLMEKQPSSFWIKAIVVFFGVFISIFALLVMMQQRHPGIKTAGKSD